MRLPQPFFAIVGDWDGKVLYYIGPGRWHESKEKAVRFPLRCLADDLIAGMEPVFDTPLRRVML